MIYLLNSAYRSLHRTNILNTFFLPTGHTNEYRYRAHGREIHVDPTAKSKLEKIESGEDSLVIYIDRYNPGSYYYYPLRFAKYLLWREEGNHYYFRVQLEDFIFPRDLSEFNDRIVQALRQHGLPMLKEGDPDNTDDGYYVIIAEDFCDRAQDFFIGNNAWDKAVDSLSQTKRFSSTIENQMLFLRAALKKRPHSQKELRPTKKIYPSSYQITKTNQYELTLSYKYPIQNTDQELSCNLKITTDGNLKLLPSQVKIDGLYNSIPITITSKKYLEEKHAEVKIEVSPLDHKNIKVFATDKSIGFTIQKGKAFWIQIIFALILFSILGSLIGVDFSKIQPMTIKAILLAARFKLFLGIFQTFVLFWIFLLIGRRIL